MGSSKKKTTFTKLARESRLRERRLEKQAKKDARRRASGNQPAPLGDALGGDEPSGAHVVGDVETSRSSRGAV